MTNRNKIILASAALLVSFAFGRYSAPNSVKTEKTVTKVDDSKTNEDKVIKKIVKEITRPDGTKETDTTTSEENKKSTDNSSSSVVQEKKEIIKNSSKLTISALGGTKLPFSSATLPFYGGMVQKDVLGPINMGLFGLSTGEVGVSLGLSF